MARKRHIFTVVIDEEGDAHGFYAQIFPEGATEVPDIDSIFGDTLAEAAMTAFHSAYEGEDGRNGWKRDDANDPRVRLEYLRGQIRAECISYGEIAELESLRDHIAPDDMELREWAGIPEFNDESDA